jgi:hypothetical protein
MKRKGCCPIFSMILLAGLRSKKRKKERGKKKAVLYCKK